jgi:phage major head subunit gpT-like protein
MEITNSATLAAISLGFEQVYMSAFRSASPIASRIASVRPSTSKEEEMLFITGLPRMREWLGEREAKTFSLFEHKVANKDWELTVEVDRNDIEDDKLGKYADVISDMGRSAALLWDDLVLDTLLAGETSLTYDGQYFFDTDHPQDPTVVGSPVQSNLFTGRPLTDDNYAFVRAKMTALKGFDGKPMRVAPNLLMVGPELEVTARRIVQSQMVNVGGASVDNVQRGSAEVLVFPELSGTDWYLMDVANGMRPLRVFQRRQARLVRKDQETEDSVFWKKKFHWGVDARGVATYGLWFLAAKAKP